MPRSPTPRSGPRALGPSIVTALLVAALGLAATLVVQARGAERRHREALDAAVHDYARFALWELRARAERELMGALVSSFISTQTVVDTREREAWPKPDVVGRALRERSIRAPYLDAATGFFRLDWPERSLAVAGVLEAGSATARWIADTVAADPRHRRRDDEMVRRTWGPAGASSPRPMGVVYTNDSYGVTIDRGPARPRLVGYVTARKDGTPVATYGFLADAAGFVSPILRGVLADSPLLPPSLLRGRDERTLVGVRVVSPDGRPLYRSGPRDAGAYLAADTLPPHLGGMVMQVSLSHALGPMLVVGGWPRSRTPVLAGLLVLMAALTAVALLQLRRQQELTRLRATFVSGVSHELRTPLAEIRVFSELLGENRLPTERERTRAVQIINEEVRRLTMIVENVLTFSRPIAGDGSGVPAPPPVDVGEALARSVEAFAPLARSRGVELTCQAASGLGARVAGPALRQAMLNLLDNATKYSPPRGQVCATALRAGAWVEVRVDDQGPGVPAAERRRIWGAHTRLDRAVDRTVGGSGIGLAIVADVVDRAGGGFRVEDAPGGGARFVIAFPHVPLNPPRRPSAPAPVSEEGAADDAAPDAATPPATARS